MEILKGILMVTSALVITRILLPLGLGEVERTFGVGWSFGVVILVALVVMLVAYKLP